MKIGENCVLGQNVFIGKNVKIFSNVKIQNNVSVYEGVVLKKCLLWTERCIHKCKFPRSKLNKKYIRTIVNEGASIGANSTIICGVKLGKNSLIGAGSLITKSVPNNTIVIGNPGKVVGWISNCGKKIKYFSKK